MCLISADFSDADADSVEILPRLEGCLCLLKVRIEKEKNEVAMGSIYKMRVGCQEQRDFNRAIPLQCESPYLALAKFTTEFYW